MKTTIIFIRRDKLPDLVSQYPVHIKLADRLVIQQTDIGMAVGVSLDGIIQVMELLFGESKPPEFPGILHVHPLVDHIEIGLQVEGAEGKGFIELG